MSPFVFHTLLPDANRNGSRPGSGSDIYNKVSLVLAKCMNLDREEKPMKSADLEIFSKSARSWKIGERKVGNQTYVFQATHRLNWSSSAIQ